MSQFARSFLVVIGLLPMHAFASDSHRIDILLDTSGSMRQVHQPVVSTVQTLSWSMVLAAEQNQFGDVALTLSGFCESAEQVRLGGSEQFDAAAWPDAAAGLAPLAQNCQGQEDGWNAVYAALHTRPNDQPGHVLLITDEARSAADDQLDQLDQMALLKTLYDRQLVLDAMVSARVSCGDGRRAVGMTNEGIGYVATASGTFDQCTNASIRSARGTVLSDYVTLAIASGGSVWDIGALYRRSSSLRALQSMIDVVAQAYTSVVLDRSRWDDTSVSAMARPLVSTTRAGLGEAIRLNGYSSVASRPDLGVSEWHWDVNGDGTPDYYGPDGYHAFHESGFHTVTLTVVDMAGNKDSSTLWIEVLD